MRTRESGFLAALAAVSLTGAPAALSQTGFTDVTAAAGVAHCSEIFGASFGDLNGDGYPDIFVSNHRTRPSLFLNQGNGTFQDVGTQTDDWFSHPTKRHARRRPGATLIMMATRICWSPPAPVT